MYTPFVPQFYKMTTLDPRPRSSTRSAQELCDYAPAFFGSPQRSQREKLRKRNQDPIRTWTWAGRSGRRPLDPHGLAIRDSNQTSRSRGYGCAEPDKTGPHIVLFIHVSQAAQRHTTARQLLMLSCTLPTELMSLSSSRSDRAEVASLFVHLHAWPGHNFQGLAPVLI